ncbi:unnamed protein product [Arctia plantaginis]|uniref:Uncharacterized protein n=1 Tax=Arctia plantaginis TaxID=874455 RepID=A0A8S1AIM0_ARCPL|nr:unnamed protein product [Arctia plantaginis]
MPAVEDADETLLLDENDYIDESKLKVDVLEDEFRLKSESDTDLEITEEKSKPEANEIEPLTSLHEPDFLDNPAKNATKAYKNKKLLNGLQNKYSMDICMAEELLTHVVMDCQELRHWKAVTLTSKFAYLRWLPSSPENLSQLSTVHAAAINTLSA